MKSLKRVWAAAQRNPIEENKSKNQTGAEGDDFDSDTDVKGFLQVARRFFQTVLES